MQILFLHDKQQHTNIMFIYITSLWTLITYSAFPSPFPDQLPHRWDVTPLTFQDSNKKADKIQYIH